MPSDNSTESAISSDRVVTLNTSTDAFSTHDTLDYDETSKITYNFTLKIIKIQISV
jgi:hypothetical protein